MDNITIFRECSPESSRLCRATTLRCTNAKLCYTNTYKYNYQYKRSVAYKHTYISTFKYIITPLLFACMATAVCWSMWHQLEIFHQRQTSSLTHISICTYIWAVMSACIPIGADAGYISIYLYSKVLSNYITAYVCVLIYLDVYVYRNVFYSLLAYDLMGQYAWWFMRCFGREVLRLTKTSFTNTV